MLQVRAVGHVIRSRALASVAHANLLKGSYSSSIRNLDINENDPVLVIGTGKASNYHNRVAKDYGTNVVAAVSPGKGGQTFLDQPVYSTLEEVGPRSMNFRPQAHRGRLTRLCAIINPRLSLSLLQSNRHQRSY